jgi:hypothetical protein
VIGDSGLNIEKTRSKITEYKSKVFFKRPKVKRRLLLPLAFFSAAMVLRDWLEANTSEQTNRGV